MTSLSLSLSVKKGKYILEYVCDGGMELTCKLNQEAALWKAVTMEQLCLSYFKSSTGLLPVLENYKLIVAKFEPEQFTITCFNGFKMINKVRSDPCMPTAEEYC